MKRDNLFFAFANVKKLNITGLVLAVFVFSIQGYSQTPTFQQVTTPPNNVTTNDIYVNQILGQEVNRSSIVIGTGNTYNSGAFNGQSYVIGYHNSAIGSYTSVFGAYNNATGGNSLMIGRNNFSSGTGNMSFGRFNSAAGGRNTLVGWLNSSLSNSYQATSFGAFNTVGNVGGTAIGFGNYSNGYKSSAFGYENSATGKNASSFGTQNNASGERSVAFGYQNGTSALYAIAFGKENVVSGQKSVAVGTANTITASYAHVFGRDITNNVSYSVKMGVSNTAYMMILQNGNIGIGTENPQAKLAVNGTIFAKKVKVTLAAGDWPDYVFSRSYNLMPLGQLENYIKTNNHLPNIPAATTVAKEGIDVGNTQAQLLQKIEELTLYVIELNKKVEAQSKEIKTLKKKKK